MLKLRINKISINIYVFKEPNEDTYTVVSGDDEGHEGRLAFGLVTIDELAKVLKENFGQEEIDCISVL